MGFWSLPNEKETAANVDAFLRGQIKRLAMRAGVNLTDLSSLQLSQAPAHSSKNSVEEKMQTGLIAIEMLQAIRYTMEQTYGISPQLLVQYYILQYPVWKIRNNLLIDHDSFRDYKQTALNQFAECWVNTQDKYEWDDDQRIDLRVYTE